MKGEKIYLQPKGTVLDAINDIVELQNGRLTFSDTPRGKIYFAVRMYVSEWELRFTVTDIGGNRSQVQIEIEGGARGGESLIHREFALLDSMLVTRAKIELAERGGNGEGGNKG